MFIMIVMIKTRLTSAAATMKKVCLHYYSILTFTITKIFNFIILIVIINFMKQLRLIN